MPPVLAKPSHSFAPSVSSPPPPIRWGQDTTLQLHDSTEVTGAYQSPKQGIRATKIGRENGTWSFDVFVTLTRNGDLWGQGQGTSRQRGSGRTHPCHGPCGCHAISAATKRRSFGQNRRHASLYARVWMFLGKFHCLESPSQWTPLHSVFGVAAVVDSVLRTFPEVLRVKKRCPLLKMSIFSFWPWKVTSRSRSTK